MGEMPRFLIMSLTLTITFPTRCILAQRDEEIHIQGDFPSFVGTRLSSLYFLASLQSGVHRGSAAKKEEAVVGARPSGQLLLQRLTTCEICASIKIER